MLWTFERRGCKRLIEIRWSVDVNGYELRHIDADGREVTEWFSSLGELSRRMVRVEKELCEDGWSLAGSVRL